MRAVYPELVTGRVDDYEDRAWTVKPGWALRGHASCDFVARVLEVPLGATEVDRVIRAHELMHVRVSPHDVNPLALYPELTPRALECAEEFRVNELLRRLRFPVESLLDGSESVSAERLCVNGAWDEVATFFVATVGTGAERAFVRGVRRVRPEWAKALTVVRRRVLAVTSVLATSEIGATERSGVGELPRGFDDVTVPVARVIVAAAESATPTTPDELRRFRRSLEPGGRRAPSGRFADLVFDVHALSEGGPPGRCGRRSAPSVSGTVMRYPSRLLVDPHRRAFARVRPGRGGVVVVDQSGSMDLDASDLDHLLRAAPGALVVGYSHRPGDRSGRPNAWVVARDGRRVRDLPTGNVGNGVDGPVLAWAVAHRRPGDVVVWVTDGQVTDSHDHPSRDLSRECARLVRRHRIELVRSVADAARRLRRRGIGGSEPATAFGRVGRELAEIGRVTGPS